MSVYVDPAVYPWRGYLWCHLYADSLEELHEFAKKIGLKCEWFQAPPKCSLPHYDMVESRRAKAIKAGAIELTSRTQIVERCYQACLQWEAATGTELKSTKIFARGVERAINQNG